MLIYFLYFFILITCSFVGNLKCFSNKTIGKKIITVWVPVTILIILSTLKSNAVGTDTYEYFKNYQKCSSMEINSAIQWLDSYELGFRYMFVLFSYMGFPFRIFQLVLYTIVYTLLGIVVSKESKYPAMSFIIFSLWSFMIFNFSGLRQCLADTFAFFSLFLVSRKKNKIWKTIVNTVLSLGLLGVAILFHSSSLVFVAAFILFGIYKMVPEYFRKITFYIVIAVLIIFLLSPELYQYFFYLSKKNYYLPTERYKTGGLFVLYYLILIFSFVFSEENFISRRINDYVDMTCYKLFKKTPSTSVFDCVDSKPINDFCRILIAVFSIGVIIESFSSVSFTITRLSNPFLLSSVIMIPNIIFSNKSKCLRWLAEVGIILVLAIVFYVDNYSINYLNCFPYSF